MFVCVHNNEKIEHSYCSSQAPHQRQLVGCLRAYRFLNIIHERAFERGRENTSQMVAFLIVVFTAEHGE